MFNLFRKRPVAEIRIEIVKREIYDITAQQWRSDPELVKVAARTLADPNLRQLLAVCRNEHLGRLSLDARAPDGMQLAFAHRAQGFGIALNTLESLGTPIKREEAPKATYAAENWYDPDTQPQPKE